MASILDLVKHYQHAIEKYPNDEQKILKSIDKLFNLGVTVQHLQETGVGRTVNALRKEPGDVGKAARALVYKWKLMVAAEESDHEEDHNQPTTYNGHENEKTSEDSDYESKHKQNQYNKMERMGEVEESYSSSKYVNGDYSGGKRKHQSSEEEEPYVKKSRHITTQNEAPEKVSHVSVKKEPETDSDSASSHSDEDGDSDSKDSESSEEHKSSRHKTKTEHKRLPSPKQSASHEKHKSDSSASGKSHKHSEKHSKHTTSEAKLITDKSSKEHKSSSSHKHRKEKDSSSHKKENSDHKVNDKEKKKKESKEESSSKHRSSSEKSSSHKSSSHSDKSKSNSEKSSSKSEKHSSSHKEKSEKDKNKHSSEKSSDKHKSKDKEHSSSKDKEHSSSKDKHHLSSKEKVKDKDSSSKDKENSHKSDKKHSSSSDTSAKENFSRSKSDKTDEHKRSSDDKEKKSSSKSSHSSKSSKSSSSSSSSKSKDIPKKKSEKDNGEDGIDCGSGASFAEALGMISPSKPKKKSFTKDTSFSPNNSGSNDDLTPAALLAPNALLAPLPALEISALPEISPNYKPRPPPKFLPHFTDEDAISAGISSKNQRTKVYSGNKVLGKIPTLYEMCVQILQEHIDALEYTGGVPYEILKPIVDKATPQQLYMLEHFNPYLMEDTDHLWQKFCEKSFRNKKRQELESWREMFIRCQEEQENRLRSLTANIKIAQEAKKAPIKQTKMAYVDSIVKPPRNVARKQAQHGTAFAASASPAARVAALAAAPNVLKGNGRPIPVTTVTSAAFQKPKKAPLMQKALQFMRGRKR